VWGPEQAIKLFDSLVLGYPINTVMPWQLEPQNLSGKDIYRFVRDCTVSCWAKKA